jgi:hypothetical protein
MRTLVNPITITVTDERVARADLRAQIARLDRALTHAPQPAHGPRLLTLAELEAQRDALAAELARQSEAARAEHDARQASRHRLEAMLADPPAHRFERVALTDLGDPGCGVYMVRPRLGLVGMLAGWWEVKLSSGCPLCLHVSQFSPWRSSPSRPRRPRRSRARTPTSRSA